MKPNLYMVKKGLLFLSHYGIRNTVIKALEKGREDKASYKQWYEKQKLTKEEQRIQTGTLFDKSPCFSILVPIYNTPIPFFTEMIDSVRNQTYKNWELCIANASPQNKALREALDKVRKLDSRIKVIDVPENEGISQNTNKALSIATGEYIGLLDHDDLLLPEALFEYVKLINEDNQVEVLYSDEDKITEDTKEVFDPNFKPDYNEELLRNGNYICHFFAAKRALVESLGGFRKEYNGAQDYDLILRVTRKAKKTAHVKRVLYHWRVHKASTADNPFSKKYAYEAGLKAIAEDLRKAKEEGVVEETENMGFYKVSYKYQNAPEVLIAIYGRNEESYELYKDKLQRIITYPNYTIIRSRNNPQQVRDDAACKYILFLDEGMSFNRPDFIEEMIACISRDYVGAVGVRINRGSKTLHGGLKIGNGRVDYLFAGLHKHMTGYMHRASLSSCVRGVSISCMMVKTSVVQGNDHFDSREARAADWGISINQQGKRVIYLPEIEANSKYLLPGIAPIDEKKLLLKWGKVFEAPDPYYNENLDACGWGY